MSFFENPDARIIYAVLALAFAATVLLTVRVARRDPLRFSNWVRRMGSLLLNALGLLLLGYVYLRVVMHYPWGWMSVWIIEAEMLLTALGYYAIRWWRYPGLFESKSRRKVAVEVLLGCLLFMVCPLLFVSHIGGALLPEGTLRKLGLEFKLGKYDYVGVDDEAPDQFHPGEAGWIKSVRVVSAGDMTFHAEATVGSVFYGVSFSGLSPVDIPEAYLFKLP